MKELLIINNLKCSGCERIIIEKLESIKGVNNPKVNTLTGEVGLDIDNLDILELVKKMLDRMGYPVIGQHNSTIKKSKSYISCMIGKVKNSLDSSSQNK